MSDIVERLRFSAASGFANVGEAADEIERLQRAVDRSAVREVACDAVIERLGSHISHLEAHRDDLMAKIERLKAALREIADLSSVSVRAPHIARNALEGKP